MQDDDDALVEAVARAMCADAADDWKAAPDDLKRAWLSSARAAIAAVRAHDAAQGRVTVSREALDDLRSSVIAFAAPWAVEYAKAHGLPPGHLHPTHYDILADAGARMDSFTRAAAQEAGDA